MLVGLLFRAAVAKRPGLLDGRAGARKRVTSWKSQERRGTILPRGSRIVRLAEGVDSIAQYADLGVDRLVVPLPVLGEKPLEGLDKLANEAIAKQG